MYFWCWKKTVKMEKLTQPNVQKMPVHEAIDSIVSEYHSYFRNSLPAIATILSAVAKIDDKVVSDLDKINAYFIEFKILMEQHISKEKFILFPAIQKLSLTDELSFIATEYKKVYHRVWNDIDIISTLLKRINSLTNNYNSSAIASPSLRQCYLDMRMLEKNCLRYFEMEKKYLSAILA